MARPSARTRTPERLVEVRRGDELDGNSAFEQHVLAQIDVPQYLLALEVDQPIAVELLRRSPIRQSLFTNSLFSALRELHSSRCSLGTLGLTGGVRAPLGISAGLGLCNAPEQ